MSGTTLGARITSVLLLAVAACSPAPPPDPLEVATSYGPVRGVEELGVRVFRGIPYAAAPAGELRWRPPRPPEPWQIVRAAEQFGPICPQPLAEEARGITPMSEDCLSLNVWTPMPADEKPPRPVLVFLHGGGFRTGSGSSPIYDGRHFVEAGAVLVTINYRLGPLGFFAHPALAAAHPDEPRANYGVLDMIAALRWVQENIAAFGGDPSRVAIFGESAGGMAIQLLMSAPAAAGLFQRAISQSGYGTWPLPRTAEAPPRAGSPSAEEIAIGIVERAGAEDPRTLDVAALRTLHADDLVAAIATLHLPIVDGRVIPEEPGIVFARGEQHDVPFLVGGNSFDGAVMQMAGLDPAAYLATWRDQDAVRSLYADDFAVSEALGASRLFGDNRYLIAARYLAEKMETRSAPAYVYYFAFVPPAKRGEWPGAPHAADLPFLFGNPFPLVGLGELGPEGERLGRTMRDAWIRFAATGDPNGEGLPAWPPYSRQEDRWMVFDDPPEVRSGVIAERLDFLEQRYLERVGEP